MAGKGEREVHDHEVRIIVAEVLAEQKRLHNNDIDKIFLETVTTMLTSFGIEEKDRNELKADFVHLRRWRKSVEQAGSLTFRIVVTALVTGFVGAVWLGFKTMVGK